MTITTIKTGILVTVAMASVIATLIFARQSQAKLREKGEMMGRNSTKMSELSAENERLLRQIAESDSSSPSESEQLRELLRLRADIRQLRQAVTDLEKVRTSHQQLLVAWEGMKAGIDPSAPDPQVIQAHWSKDQLGFAGYADPTAALKSALWAMTHGDANALVSSVTPEAKAKLEREGWYDRRSPGEEIADSSRKIAESLSPSYGFSVVGQKMVSEDLAILGVYFEGEGRTRKIAMKKVGAEWRFNAMGRAGDNEDDNLQNGYVAWP